MKVYQGIEELIGKTPLLRLFGIEKKYGLSAKLVVKLEGMNPAGSAKDRVAREIIRGAEESGRLTPGSVIIEPTSGNTGIGLAAIAAARGYSAVIVMPEGMSEERKLLMRAYGAKLIESPRELGMPGAIKRAEELQKEIPGSIIAGQFTNPDNPKAHYLTTGPEIYDDTDGEVDIFVGGIGTGGTVSGVGKYLKEKNSDIKIIGVEPADSPVLTGGTAGAHGIQGIGAGFVPEILDLSVIDKVEVARLEDAISAARELARVEGILVGISSGAALSVAINEAMREENRGKTVVALLPDTGERYLSAGLFE